jgi:hypothetical protein
MIRAVCRAKSLRAPSPGPPAVNLSVPMDFSFLGNHAMPVLCLRAVLESTRPIVPPSQTLCALAACFPIWGRALWSGPAGASMCARRVTTRSRTPAVSSAHPSTLASLEHTRCPVLRARTRAVHRVRALRVEAGSGWPPALRYRTRTVSGVQTMEQALFYWTIARLMAVPLATFALQPHPVSPVSRRAGPGRCMCHAQTSPTLGVGRVVWSPLAASSGHPPVTFGAVLDTICSV